MEGSLEHPDNYGVIPRAAEAIFEELNKEELNYESYNVFCSYLEIYNEELCDLLIETGPNSNNNNTVRSSPSKKSGTQKLEIMEGKNGPFCRGLSEKQVHSEGELLDVMRTAQRQRKVGETNMNKQSSRSHCIFTLRVEAKRRLADGALFETRGKLHMVDLAGSECAKTASLDGGGSQQAARERERMNINRSLLTLGRVVKLLKEQSTKSKPGNVRIPYRDSKLTRILQQALGGNSKTVIIGTLSPSVTAIEESISTLNYAQAAHGIINKPVSASYLSEATKSSSILSGMENSGAGPQSLEHWKEMEVRLEYMKCQVEEAKAALARKHLQQQELVDRAEKAEAEKTVLEDKLTVSQEKVDTLQVELVQAEEKQFQTEQELGETKASLEKTTLVLQATQKTESSLTSEALALIDALKKSVADGEQLYGVVIANRDADIERRQAAKQFHGSVAALLMEVKQALKALSEEGADFQNKSSDLANTAATKETEFLQNAKAILETVVTCVDGAVTTLKSSIHEKDGIVPTADSVTKETFDRIGKAWSLLESSEQTLISQFKSTREQLTTLGSTLTDKEKTHIEASEKTLSMIESTVATSKRKVEDLVSSTNSALEQVQQARKKIRDATRENVEQWKLSMVQSGDLILKQSTTQRALVEENESMLTKEMQRHANIETQLNNQGFLLESSRAASVSTHQAQKELLLQTQTNAEASHNNQSQLLNSFVQRLMKDVTSLVENQVSEVINEVNSGHASFLESSASLMHNHTDITSATLDTLQKAEDLKSSVQQEAEIAKETDKKVISHLAETKSVFADVEKNVNDHQTNVETFACGTLNKLTESEELESMDLEVREKLNANGKEYLSYTSEQHNCMVSALSEQTDAGKAIVTFTRSEVLETTTAALNDMVKPRSEMMSAYAQQCSGLEDCLEKGLAQIKEKASVSSQIADELHGKIQSVKTDFLDTTVADRSSEIAQTKATFLEHGNEHVNFTTRRIASAEDGSTKAGSATENFVRGLSAYMDVPDAPEKVNISYSDRLSSTPSEQEILGKVGRKNAGSVLGVLSPNRDNVMSSSNANKQKRPSGHAVVPNFANGHERSEPRSEINS